jgi:hypothetical protein
LSRRGEIHRKPDAMARLRMSQGQKGKRCPPRTMVQKEHIQQIQLSKADEYREKALAAWANPEIRQKQVEAILDGSHILPTKAEFKLRTLIETVCSDEYVYTGDGKIWRVVINGLIPDFTRRDKKKVIEMLGDHWHTEEFKGKTQEEEVAEKLSRYKAWNTDCLLIWEHELKDTGIVEEKIKAFNNNVSLDLSELNKKREETRGTQLAFF